MNAQVTNQVMTRMISGEVALGITSRIARSGEICRIARASGHDFVRIDTQHTIYDVETIGHIAQMALACGVDCLVRVRGIDDHDIGRLLDSGVTGIVFPDIEVADEARRCVDVVKYPPIGSRSMGSDLPHFDHQSVPRSEVIRVLNGTTMVVCMIESVAGLRNIEDIADVDGLDVIHIGLNDLLLDMSRTAPVDEKTLLDCVDRVIAVSDEKNRFVGCGGTSSVELQAMLVRKGVRLLTTKSDIGFLSMAASRWVTELNAASRIG